MSSNGVNTEYPAGGRLFHVVVVQKNHVWLRGNALELRAVHMVAGYLISGWVAFYLISGCYW